MKIAGSLARLRGFESHPHRVQGSRNKEPRRFESVTAACVLGNPQRGRFVRSRGVEDTIHKSACRWREIPGEGTITGRRGRVENRESRQVAYFGQVAQSVRASS